jgi:hypothetical protein
MLTTIGELRPFGIKECACHGCLKSLQVSLGHDWLNGIYSPSIDQGFLGTIPLSQIQDNKEAEILERVGSPTIRGGVGIPQVIDDTFGDCGLSKKSRILFRLGQVFDETTCPTDSLRLSRSRLGSGGRVGQQLLKNTNEGIRVFEGRHGSTATHGRVLEDGDDAGLEEGKIHQTDATEVRLLLILCDNFAETANDFLCSGSESHYALILGGDGKVIQCETSQMTSITRLLGEAFGKGCENVPFTRAYHRYTVLLVAYIAKLVDSLNSSCGLFAFLLLNSLEEFRDIIEMRRLCALFTFRHGRFDLWKEEREFCQHGCFN